jgi:hypothetical protein
MVVVVPGTVPLLFGWAPKAAAMPRLEYFGE